MHTDSTVDHLRLATAEFATCLRKVGPALEDLPAGKSRKRKHMEDEAEKKNKKKAKEMTDPQDTLLRPSINCNTVKLHSLGDYARTILRLGSTDSYSTSLVRNVLIYL